ncbi:hypothetical protein [Thermospira aquatica]|uniref:Uncharacterized protein n=1 Tax=Thermospira aquatica TaxID=2828656 RepID=A0AAX3BBD8_9SPIR|nr:hypothetical protein [Thermospira aquatica]URA09533.1 hypothetical protein KDW03_08545 [Thermospira aquatica]
MKYLISLFIVLFVGGLIVGYAAFVVWALSVAQMPWWGIGFVSMIFLVLIAGLIVAFFARIKEVSKEDKDDYRNY